jgi:acyl-CoA thioesterase FadM
MAWKKVGGRFVRHKRILETAERARRAADNRLGGHPLSLESQALSMPVLRSYFVFFAPVLRLQLS